MKQLSCPKWSGATALLMLKLLEKFDLTKMEPCAEIHLEAEVAKLAYSARDQLIGDPKVSDIDVDKFYSDGFVIELLNSIDVEKE